MLGSQGNRRDIESGDRSFRESGKTEVLGSRGDRSFGESGETEVLGRQKGY